MIKQIINNNFTCRGEDERKQGVMTGGGQNQEDPSILSALHRQDASGNKNSLQNKSPPSVPPYIQYLSECTSDLRGRMARRTAFSWTCQPNRKEPRAQSSRQRRKPRVPRGRHQMDATAGCRESEREDRKQSETGGEAAAVTVTRRSPQTVYVKHYQSQCCSHDVAHWLVDCCLKPQVYFLAIAILIFGARSDHIWKRRWS